MGPPQRLGVAQSSLEPFKRRQVLSCRKRNSQETEFPTNGSMGGAGMEGLLTEADGGRGIRRGPEALRCQAALEPHT